MLSEFLKVFGADAFSAASAAAEGACEVKNGINAVQEIAEERNILKDRFCHSHDHFFFRLQDLGILRRQTAGSIYGRCGI